MRNDFIPPSVAAKGDELKSKLNFFMKKNDRDKVEEKSKCLGCGKELKSKRAKFCSRECLKNYRRKENKKGSWKLAFYDLFINIWN